MQRLLAPSTRALAEGVTLAGRKSLSSRRTNPDLEALEAIELLSGVQTLSEPPVSVTATLTNFGPPSPLPPQLFNPTLPLFDPNLGTLVAVHVSGSAQIRSQIGVENLTPTTPTTISASIQGQFQVSGLPQVPIQGSFVARTGDPGQEPPFNAAPFDGVVDFAGTSGHTFNAVTATDGISPQTLTLPSDLAFYIASAGRTTITPTFSANAQGSTQAPDGNLATSVMTSASASLNVSYDYIPKQPPQFQNLVRFGAHHNPTRLVVSFSGPLDPAQASNPGNYQIASRGRNGQFGGPGSESIPVGSAAYDPATNSVTLLPIRRLNVHHLFQLTVDAPVFGTPGSQNFMTVFGGLQSLGGFNLHGGRFVAVVNGHVVR